MALGNRSGLSAVSDDFFDPGKMPGNRVQIDRCAVSVLVAQFQLAVMQRAGIPEEGRKGFHLYIDEFQNFTTGSFKSILSKAY